MYRYILFDLDGTLTDPKLGICTCVQHALSKMGIEEPDLDKLEPFIGPPLKDSFTEFYGMSEEDAQKAIVFYRERFSTVGKFENEVYPGIPELLADLKKKDKYLAIASSKPTVFVEDILKHFEIREYFDLVVGSELDGTRATKEEVLDYTIKAMFPDSEVEYEEIVMVGDRKYDIDAAHNLGVGNIGVSYGYGSREELEEAGADKIVNTVQGLRTTLLPVFNQNSVKSSTASSSQTAEKKKENGAADWKQQGKNNGRLTFAKTWSFIGPVMMYWIGGMAFFYLLTLILSYICAPNENLLKIFQDNLTKWMLCINAVAGLLAALFVMWQEKSKKKRIPDDKKEKESEPEANVAKVSDVKIKVAYCAAIVFVTLGVLGITNGIGFWNAEAVSRRVDELNRISYEAANMNAPSEDAEISGASVSTETEQKVYSFEDVDQYEAYEIMFGQKYSLNFLPGFLLLFVITPIAQLYVYLYISYRYAKKYMYGRMPFIMTLLVFAFVSSRGNMAFTVESIIGVAAIAMAMNAYDKIGDYLYVCVAYVCANAALWVAQSAAGIRSFIANPIVFILLLAVGIALPVAAAFYTKKKENNQ